MLRPVPGPDTLPAPEPAHTLEWVLEQPVVDYLAFQCMDDTASGKRAIFCVVRSASGGITARRVTSKREYETDTLRNWMELCVWLDLPVDHDAIWTRDLDEEELWRQADRDTLDAVEGISDDD